MTGKLLLRSLGWMLLILGGTGVLVLGTFRLVPATHALNVWTLAASTFIPWLWIPALVACAGLALMLHRRWRWIAAAVTVVTLALMAWPLVPLDADRPSPGSPELTVLSANVLYGNAEVSEVSALITEDVDVLAFQEYTPAFAAQLKAAGVLEEFPHQVGTAEESAAGSMLLSRTPLAMVARARGTVFENLVASTEVDGMTWHIAAIHTAPPTMGGPRWEHDGAAVAEMLAQFAGEHLVAVGDYNAIAQHSILREMTDDGMVRDLAGPHTGALRWHPTWPTGGMIPPFARIDHALVSHSVVGPVPEYHQILGSDHAALRVTVGPRE